MVESLKERRKITKLLPTYKNNATYFSMYLNQREASITKHYTHDVKSLIVVLY